MAFFCYILECADGTFYTGFTTNPQKRLDAHNQGKGARYTRTRRPVRLVYLERQPDHATALRREIAIKAMPRKRKQALIRGGNPLSLMEAINPMENLAAFPSPDFYAIAPGRVNLLGEHVDYNDGGVLPAAIDRAIHLAVRRRADRRAHLSALDLGEEVEFDLDHLTERQDAAGRPLPTWALYPAGVAAVLLEAGYAVSGLDAAFTSNLPIGAGLSSSAALELAFAVSWRELGGWSADALTLARLSQRAEVHYVGLNCGLMDQFASACGVDGSLLYLDTRSLDWRALPLPPGLAIIIADSSIRRSLVNSGYNDRHAACEEAVALLKPHLPGMRALRDVTPDQFVQLAHLLPDTVRKRARHVVEECARVEQAVALLERGDGPAFGRLMTAGHASLRDDYEVSLPEIDTLVELANRHPACLGARLTGAGFGGCTVNLVQEDQADDFIHSLTGGYLEQTGKTASVYLCHASQGAHLSSNLETN